MCIRQLFTLLLIIKVSSAKDCVIENVGRNASKEIDLIKYLERNYDAKYPPPTNTSFVEVKAKFILKSFNFDSSDDLFSIYSLLVLSWTDDRLQWKPECYAGIDEVIVYSHDIWYPSLRIMNGDADEDYKVVFFSPCTVNKLGEVACVQKIYDKTVCSAKLWNWPYDSQICKLEVGVWKYPIKKVNLIFGAKAINMIVAGYGAEWDITDYKQEEEEDSDMQLRMIFTLERHGQILAAIIIYPGVILCVLTLTCLLLDVRNYLRLYLICFNLANHLLFMNVLGELIPKHCAEHPLLLLYYRGSVILTVLVILFSIVLKSMCEKETMPSALIERVTNYVVNSRCKYMIWKWDAQEEKSKMWVDFASLINNFILYAFIITYICMYFVYIPQPIPFN